MACERPLPPSDQGRDVFQNGEIPSSDHGEEGWPSDQENIAQHPLFARTGWCSDRWDKEHHPVGVHKEASRHFLGDAATPPRGDARRGIHSFQYETPNHISLSRPRWTSLSTTSGTLTWTDVPRRRGRRERSERGVVHTPSRIRGY